MKETEPYQKVRDFMREAYEEEFELTGGSDTLLTSLPIDTFIIHNNEIIAFEYPNNDARKENIAQLYLMADLNAINEPYQSLEEIAQLHGKLTRERIRQIYNFSLKKLYDNASPHLQDKYPFDELSVTRPQTVSMLRRRTIKKGTPILAIEEDLKKGLTTKQLIAKHGIQHVTNARINLLKWNMEAPEKYHKDTKSIINKLLDPETEDDELKRLMGLLNNVGHILSVYKDVFVPITEIQREAWNNQNMRYSQLAFQLLEEAGIPICSIEHNSGETKTYYRITLARKKEAAVEVLKKAPDSVKRDSVIKIGGVGIDEKQPTTTDFTKKLNGIKNDGYVTLFSFLDKEGISISSKEIKKLFTPEFFENSPIPIYLTNSHGRNTSTYYINQRNTAEFKKFIVDAFSKVKGIQIEEQKAFNFKMYTISQTS